MRIIQLERDTSGKIIMQTNRVYFPRSEFHCRFSSYFAMEDATKWATYHRSDFKKIEGQTKSNYKFQGNQDTVVKGMYSKIGNYYNPFHFSTYKSALKQTTRQITAAPSASWYDRLLERQKKMARYLVEKVLIKDPSFKINADNTYPCILFSLPKPSKEKNPNTWSAFLAVYLIAITNKLAYERGLNIEMVQRSSFGCLRPSLAACGESVRINLGLCPQVYVDTIADALMYLKSLFSDLTLFAIPLESAALSQTIKKYNKINAAKTEKTNIALGTTLWDTLWMPGDISNKSFASQFFRKAVTVEYFIDRIFDGCLKNSLEELFREKKLQDAFALPIQSLLLKLKLKGTSLSLAIEEKQLTKYHWKTSTPVDDEEFWKFVAEFGGPLHVIKPEISLILKNRTLQDLHTQFEIYIANFTFMPKKFTHVTDGSGSDSEEEEEVPLQDKKQTLYAKKFITATGMRAIQLIFASAKKYLYDTYHIDPLNVHFSAKHMYYETAKALASYEIPLHFEADEKDKKDRQNITFFDVNHCNTLHEKIPLAQPLIDSNDAICVLDITSATSKEVHTILVQLLEESPKLQVVMMISSGLKNEQFMGDYNPYGTIRIFTKNRESLKNIYDDLKLLEEKAQYKHPKESHWIRKTAKESGMTLTNAAILNTIK